MAVIKETLRLHPPSSSIRAGRPEVDIIAEDGQHYPTEGCNVFTLSPALHRNPKYRKEPETFNPDRWLVALNTTSTPSREPGDRSSLGRGVASAKAWPSWNCELRW